MYICKTYYLSICIPDTCTWTHSRCATWNKCAFDKHIPTNQLQQQVKAKEEYEHYLHSAIASVNSTVLFTLLHFSVIRESLWSLQTLSTGHKRKMPHVWLFFGISWQKWVTPRWFKAFLPPCRQSQVPCQLLLQEHEASGLKLCLTMHCWVTSHCRATKFVASHGR